MLELRFGALYRPFEQSLSGGFDDDERQRYETWPQDRSIVQVRGSERPDGTSESPIPKQCPTIV